MTGQFDPGALLSHIYPLPDGPRVRLRLVRGRDEEKIRELLSRLGPEPEDFDVMRLVRFNPRRAVICASALVGVTETLVGVGAIELDGLPDTEPEFVIADERIPGPVEELLAAALRGHANAIARTRAA